MRGGEMTGRRFRLAAGIVTHDVPPLIVFLSMALLTICVLAGAPVQWVGNRVHRHVVPVVSRRLQILAASVAHAAGVTESHTPNTDAEALMRDVGTIAPLQRLHGTHPPEPRRS
jgi:hypothetical protein